MSNYGRIKSYINNKKEGEIIKGSLARGYKRVQLVINKKRERKLVHKLVAETFISRPTKESIHVIHKDWNKRNNCVDNLAWVTTSEMNKRMFDEYRERNKARGLKIISHSKLKEKDVAHLKGLIKQGIPQNQLSKLFCISATQVKRITRGENWGHIQPELKKTDENATSC